MLGVDYPMRIVDHEIAAREARARLTEMRRTADYPNETKGVFLKHGSRKRQSAKVKASAKSDPPARKAAAQLLLDL
jgi:deoxyribodipyrimidine photo-lyase